MIGSQRRYSLRGKFASISQAFGFKSQGPRTDTSSVRRAGTRGGEGLVMRRNDKSWMELDELLEPFLPASTPRPEPP